MKHINKNDKVAWDSSGGTSEGKVIKKVTKPTKIKGFIAKPSKENPEFMVKSIKSGKIAVHKKEELRKT